VIKQERNVYHGPDVGKQLNASQDIYRRPFTTNDYGKDNTIIRCCHDCGQPHRQGEMLELNCSAHYEGAYSDKNKTWSYSLFFCRECWYTSDYSDVRYLQETEPMATRTVLISKTFEAYDIEEAVNWANGLVGDCLPLEGFQDRVVQEILHFQYSVGPRFDGLDGDILTMMVMCFTRPDKFKIRRMKTQGQLTKE
jgi:hypothetical protein